MKKVLIAVLTLTMLLTAAVGAMAETFTLSVPCQAIADSQLYNHHATAFAYKRNSIKLIVSINWAVITRFRLATPLRKLARMKRIVLRHTI